MNWLRGSLAKRLGTGLAFWMLALGVTVPFLERDLLGFDVAIEAEHQDACSLSTHDHTICSQFGKQPWVRSPDDVEQILPESIEDEDRPEQDALPVRWLSSPTNPRAPPSL